MAAGPEIHADTVARLKREEERVAFLRQCAVSFAGGSVLLGDVHVSGALVSDDRAAGFLVADWSMLFDAIEATRSK